MAGVVISLETVLAMQAVTVSLLGVILKEMTTSRDLNNRMERHLDRYHDNEHDSR